MEKNSRLGQETKISILSCLDLFVKERVPVCGLMVLVGSKGVPISHKKGDTSLGERKSSG